MIINKDLIKKSSVLFAIQEIDKNLEDIQEQINHIDNHCLTNSSSTKDSCPCCRLLMCCCAFLGCLMGLPCRGIKAKFD